MAYTTLPAVQELMAQFTISASSTPNTTQATAILTDVSNEIDVRLSTSGFAVPVASPAYFLSWLGLLNAYGATAAILKSMFPGAVGPGETPAYAFWEARYNEGLQALAKGGMSPPEAASNANFILPSTYLTRNPDAEESIGTIAEPIFPLSKVY